MPYSHDGRDNSPMRCKIVDVGRRRDGGTKFWCLAHHANATGKYGVATQKCVAADDPPITTVRLKVEQHQLLSVV